MLPFENFSMDPEQAHFADGLVEDLITDLSKVPLGAADYRLYANIMGGAGALGLATGARQSSIVLLGPLAPS